MWQVMACTVVWPWNIIRGVYRGHPIGNAVKRACFNYVVHHGTYYIVSWTMGKLFTMAPLGSPWHTPGCVPWGIFHGTHEFRGLYDHGVYHCAPWATPWVAAWSIP